MIRPVAGIEQDIRAVTLIPGATEFGYDPEPVFEAIAPGNKQALNRHVDGAASDWQASLDELQAVCPNLERVGAGGRLVRRRPSRRHLRAEAGGGRPDHRDDTASVERRRAHPRRRRDWSSTYDGKPAFGGTPSDASVVRAIRDLTTAASR